MGQEAAELCMPQSGKRQAVRSNHLKDAINDQCVVDQFSRVLRLRHVTFPSAVRSWELSPSALAHRPLAPAADEFLGNRAHLSPRESLRNLDKNVNAHSSSPSCRCLLLPGLGETRT